MSAGMAYEAMNNAGANKNRLIVILNDNDMSIAPPVGAMSAYLARLVSSRPYTGLRNFGKRAGQAAAAAHAVQHGAAAPRNMPAAWRWAARCSRSWASIYVGPIDGHNLDHLIPVLENVRDTMNGPVLVHVVTKKGHGYAPAEASADKYHARQQIQRADRRAEEIARPRRPPIRKCSAKPDRGSQEGSDASSPSPPPCRRAPASICSRRLSRSAPSMSASPSSMRVTFAAGLAAEGMKPFCAIYSTFLQRAYDQVVHDVAIQSLPVRFAMDRAGLVGADGATHAGSFDIAYLATLPNFVVMAAADEAELTHMVATAVAINDRPSAIRYPRGEGTGVARPAEGVPLPIGKGRMIREGSSIAILSFGTRLREVLLAAEKLSAYGLIGHRRRCALRQAAGHRPDRRWRASTKC